MLPPMIRNLFINPYDHIRAFWRIVIYVVLTFLLVMGIGWLVDFIPFPDEGDLLLTWAELGDRGGTTIAMILAAFIALRFIDRRPITLLGMSFLQGWKRDFLIGIVIGLGMLTVSLAILWAGGWMVLSLNEITPALLGGISKALLLFFVAALLEELMLRGYILQTFIEGSRVWIAVILLSSVFSIIHLDNPDSTISSSMNIFLAGMLLSVSYLKTRSLWLPTGLHLGWNWMQASFWGMGVSGFHVKWSVFAAEPQGHVLLSGGKFGAEASIIATIVLLISIVLIWKTDKLGVNKDLQTAWSAYPRGFRQPPQSASE